MSEIEKKKKKSKKSKKNENEEEMNSEKSKMLNMVASVNGEELPEKKKKRKKDKTSSAEVEEQGQEEGTGPASKKSKVEDDDSTGGSDKKKKKDKKDKKNKEKSTSSEKLQSQNGYVQHADVGSMTEDKVEEFRTERAIGVYPPAAAEFYKPLTSFDHLVPTLGLNCPRVTAYIKEKGFVTPSPIQAQCWPPLLAGKDVVGIAKTGSGKTMTFLVPALLRMTLDGRAKHSHGVIRPRLLILAPTRELAMQSLNVVKEIGGYPCVCLYGGVSKQAQKAELRADGGADVVVATPGRLEDLLDEGVLSLDDILCLVLDEADRMLDDGFEPAIRRIVGRCPAPAGTEKAGSRGRQTVMFSATWPEEIRKLAGTFLRSEELVRVTVGSEDLSANTSVTQIVECIDGRNKDRRLIELLNKYHKSRTNRCIIFVLYKREASSLEHALTAKGFNAVGIHGDKGQDARSSALSDFKAGKIPLLIATDVAARGLDIPKVEYVLNYSFPLTVEDYVHRIGRTGRAGATGISHTFFTDFDKGLAGALVGVLQQAKQEVPKEIYKYPMMTKKKVDKTYGDFGPKADLIGKKSTKITFDD